MDFSPRFFTIGKQGGFCSMTVEPTRSVGILQQVQHLERLGEFGARGGGHFAERQAVDFLDFSLHRLGSRDLLGAGEYRILD